MLLFGNGMLVVLYCREYYARTPFMRELDVWTVGFWQQFLSVYSF